MALKWQVYLRDNSDAPQREQFIQADVSIPCGIMRQEGLCPGEIKFPVITFGRHKKWEAKHTLWDDPKVLGGSPGAICPECGIQMYLIPKMRNEIRKSVVEWLLAQGSIEVDEAGY